MDLMRENKGGAKNEISGVRENFYSATLKNLEEVLYINLPRYSSLKFVLLC